MKKTKILFWISTTLIFLFEGVLTALTSRSQFAIQGITQLGYPIYFATLLTIFKVLGALILIIPKLPPRLKEWAYAGFTFDFTFAFLSLWIVNGVTGLTFFPLVVLGILMVSYVCYHKMNRA